MSLNLKHIFFATNRKLVLLALALLCCFSSFSQFKNEEELKKEASKLFEDEEYPAAFKLYSQLVSNYPKDPNYNYRLGVCMLYSEPNKKKSIQYLQFAVKNIKDAEKEALFYLGKAYHLNFQFDEAMKYYSQYKQVGSSSMQKKLLVDHEIECCKNGKRLLSNLKELVILDKKQLSQSDYFRSYDLKTIGGKLLAKPADFTSVMDKKKKDKSIIYLAGGKDVLYYASYGEKGDNKDIYEVTRQAGGEWGKAKLLGNEINTPYDEDFPFLHPNGKVLYFASKGHNSMGGFDIFKSEFDDAANKWKQPTNLDFPINSPDDDILFVTDSLEKIAFLASSRQSPAGKIDVYKILTERRPAEYAFIKGTVIKKNPNQSVLSKIKVKNIDNGEDAGTFTADENGEYSIKLSNGGKFIFTVETPGFPTQSEGVNVPTAYNYKPYRQTIEYNEQKLKITNFFDTNDGDENNYAQYLKLIEEKTKMEVNAGDFDINPANPLANANTNPKNISESNPQSVTTTTTSAVTPTNNTPVKTNINNNELVKMANEDAKELQQSADSLKQDAAAAFSAANSKQDQANEKKQEATDLQNKANAETNPAKKQELLAEAEKAKDEAELYAAQATTANNIAKQMEVDAKNKQKEADLNAQYAKALEEADKTKNNKQAIAKLEELQKQLEEASKQKSGTDNLVESIKADANNKEQELKNAEDKQKKIDDILAELGKQMEDLNSQEKDTKDKALLENIKGQKEEITNDIAEKQKESTINKTKISTLKDEADALRSQADYASNVLSGTPTATVTTSVSSNTVASVNTNTAAATNTISVSAENNPQPTAFEKESKKFDDELIAVNSAGSGLDNNKKKAGILGQYVTATDKELKDKKEALKKAKTAPEKTALNKDIKQLEDKKKSLEKENVTVAAQIKEQEKQAAVATNTTVTTNTATAVETNTTTVASNTVATTQTNTVAPIATETNTANGVNTNTVTVTETKTTSVTPTATTVATTSTTTVPDTTNLAATNPKLAEVNNLITQTKTSTEKEKKIFDGAGYKDPKAAELKKQADEKFSASLKNQAQLEQQLKDLQGQLAKGGGSNPATEKQITEIKNKLNKEKQIDNTALKLLADAGKAEYNSSLTTYNAEEKKLGSNYDAQELLTKGANMYKSANADLSNLFSAKGDDQKQNLYLSANEKLEDAITLVKKATVALSNPDTEAVVTNTNPSNTNTVVPENTNTVTTTNTNTVQPVNTNTAVAATTNTVTPVNTNTVEPANTNTTSIASNTVVPVNSNTVEPTNTNTVTATNTVAATNTNTVAPSNTGTLSETQLQEVKNSPEYQKVASFKNTINKYNESANIDAEKSQEESLRAAQLTKEAEAMPGGPERQKKEQEAAAAKQKADSLQEMANNTRALAQSKKQELDDYSSNLDKATNDKIAAASLQTTVGTPPAQNPGYSAAYTEKSKQLDGELVDLRNQGNSPENLKKQNEVITTYISNIDNEVASKKKEQAATGSPEQKNAIAAEIKNLQLKKIALNNDRTSNENSLRSQSGTNVAVNTPVTNTPANNTPVNNNNPTNNTPANNTNPTNTSTAASSTEKYLSTGGFEIKKGNAYSQRNPIPVDEKLPDGLYFRVQIGAFKNPIPQDRFSGLAPIGAETTPAGFVRYQVGLFNKYQAAVAVKNDMRKLKYNDAFVVAYKNGKRISLAEALDTLRKSGEDVIPNANSTAGITVNSNIPVNPEATTNTVTNPVKVDDDLNSLNGIFYTIQIGVYGNNVSAAGLLNLSPVFREALPTGYNRYTAGIYSDFEKVKADRARVNSIGIPDAFVSGYLNGKRVAVNEPLDKFAGNAAFLQQRPIIFPDAQTQPANNTTVPTNTTVATNVQPFSNGVTEGPAPTATNGVKTTDEGITFKVQIGAFRNQVPADVANNWLKVKTWPVKYITINDLYVYMVGSFSEPKFAINLRNEIVALGITDAFVVVFKDGKKLTGAEAIQYLNR